MTTPPCRDCGYPVRRPGDTCQRCRRADRLIHLLCWLILAVIAYLIAAPFWGWKP